MSPFLQFKCDLDNFLTELNTIINDNNEKIKILLEKENKSYNNFVKPMQILEERLELFFTPLSHLNAVNNSDKTQEIYSASLPIITEYGTKVSQNIDIYNTYKNIQKNEKNSLNYQQKRVLKLNIEHFELSGAHLNEKVKKRLEKINIKLSKLSNDFSQNLLNATNAYEYIITNEDDVNGIAQSEKNNARFEENGLVKYRFTLQMPSYIAYMTYGRNRTIREEIYKAYVSRAPENGKIIEELLALKDEMSKLLGFKNYIDYSLSSKMAKDEKSVLFFLNKLLQNSKKQAQKELNKLQKISPQVLKSFDTAFYGEILKKKQYDIDEEEYRPYFEQKNVLTGMFKFLNNLFNIKFFKVKEELWHKKAFSYDLHINNKVSARVYFDLEARKSKIGGAWMHNWQTHYIDKKGQEHLASAFVICNFPSSTEKSPSLLRHDDVVTLFHEMGHTIHHLLSTVNENEVSGVNGVEWDAVEFPSQFLENFAYEPEVLKIFANHYKTKEVISDEMINKLVRSKNFLSAIGMLRQLEFSIFDFKIHSHIYNEKEVQNILDKIRKDTTLVKTPTYNKFQNGFAHIFAGGYAAGYYSYKWAEVLSADVFYKVIDEGIFNSKTANSYLKIVLSKGGSKSMELLFAELMGRDPDTDKLLCLNGIKS